MTLLKPIPNIYRHGSSETNRPYKESRQTQSGKRYLLAFETLKRDLLRLFEYIEPCSDNYGVYSQRTFELILRACTEVEANCRQVFRVNGVDIENGNILRYSDLNGIMKLSQYEVCCPAIDYPSFTPFSSFASSIRKMRSPSWYKEYNEAKHDRANSFSSARLSNVIEALGALFVLLSAQYGYDFDGGIGSINGISIAPLKLYSIQQHPTWTIAESYSFNWDSLREKGDPYGVIDIPIIEGD